MALTGISLLATLATALQLSLSSNTSWVWLKSCFAAFVCSLILLCIFLGKEFGWWYVHGEVLDKLGMAWIGVTILVATLVYWLTR